MTRPQQCRGCARTLMTKRLWEQQAPERRPYRTHSLHVANGLCATCYTRLRRGALVIDADIPYLGGWIRVGSVLKPDPNGTALEEFGEWAS